MNKILLLEEEADMQNTLCILLSRSGYEVFPAQNETEAFSFLSQKPDLIILNITFYGLSGFDICRKIRGDYECNIPVLFLSASDSIELKKEGMESGGDDYLARPFYDQELLIRISALLRRYQVYCGKEKNLETWLIAGDLKLSEQYNDVFLGNKRIDLPEIEYRMLRLFMQHRNKIFSIQNLYETIWNEPFYHSCANTVMVHIRKLRLKIEKKPGKPLYIQTVWGRGYRFCV
ncbi:MAG: response regulator transcription factor [Lachnospiraceae bacterium]|nr:response regulator transcription factor [Lachnospiraceae bacterium]